jgi:hypothetical protein
VALQKRRISRCNSQPTGSSVTGAGPALQAVASHLDHVQVVVRWQWPDAFEGLSTRDLLEVQKRIAAGDWRESEQAADWAGKAVAEVLRFDLSSAPLKSKVKALLKSWLASGALRVVKRNDRDRKERPFIEVGQWAGD